MKTFPIDRRFSSPRIKRSLPLLVWPIAFLAIVALAEVSVSAEPPVNNPSTSTGAATDSPRIAFVHLRFVGDQVQLIDFKVVPGRFKPTPEPTGERILLQVVGSSGTTLWEGWLNDPRTRLLEHEDPTRGGRLTGKVIAVPNPEVVVRVPFVEEGQTIRVSRAAPGKVSRTQHQPLGGVQLREH